MKTIDTAVLAGYNAGIEKDRLCCISSMFSD